MDETPGKLFIVAVHAVLPSQFELVSTFDEKLGLHRARDAQGYVLLLRVCGAESIDADAKAFCMDWMRRNSRQEVPGVWLPKRLIQSKSSGAFVGFDDFPAMPLEQALCISGRFDALGLIESLRSVARGVDCLEQQRASPVPISLKTILVTEREPAESVLVDVRLLKEFARRIDSPTARSSTSDLAGRVAFLTLLEELLCAVEPHHPEQAIHGLRLGISPGWIGQLHQTFAEMRASSSKSCEKCLGSLTELIQRLSHSGRWEIAVEFPEDDPRAPDVGAEQLRDLPEIKRSNPANPIASKSSFVDNDIPSRATTAKPSVPSNGLIISVFLFSMMTLAGVAGFKHGWVTWPHASSTGPSSSPPLVYSQQQIDNRKAELQSVEDEAKNRFKLDVIAPNAWKAAKLDADNARQYLIVNSSEDFMNSAGDAIKKFNNASSIAAGHQAYSDILQKYPDLKSVSPQIREQEPAGFDAALKLVDESIDFAKNERFAEAASKYHEAYDKITSIEPQARLNAAKAAIDPAAKLSFLMPLLEKSNPSREVVTTVSGLFEKDPQLWLIEARKRIDKLGPVESLAASCELARAGAATKDSQLFSDALKDAIGKVSQLPGLLGGMQAATAVIQLLEVVTDYRSDLPEAQKDTLTKNATEQVSQWAAASLTDPLDLAMVAGYCYQLGNFPAWGRLTKLAFSQPGPPNLTEEAVAINFVVAHSGLVNHVGFDQLSRIVERAPVAAALAAACAEKSNDTQADAYLNHAAKILPTLDGNNKNDSKAHEILSSLQALHGEPIGATNYQPATWLTGLAAAMECQYAARSEQFDSLLKRWDAFPQPLPQTNSLLKAKATIAIVQAGMRQRGKLEEVVRWSMSRPTEFDKTIACIAASYQPGASPRAAASPGFTPHKLEPGSVLVWDEYAGTGAAFHGSRATGGLRGGGGGSNSPPGNSSPRIRFYIRTVKDQEISGFLERTPINQLYYCSGTYDGRSLSCQAEPLIPVQADRRSMRHFYALFGERDAIAASTTNNSEFRDPAIASLNVSRNQDRMTPEEQKLFEDLEARLLVDRLANGATENGGSNPVVKWSTDPWIFIQGPEALRELALSSLKRLGDRPFDSPFSRYNVIDARKMGALRSRDKGASRKLLTLIFDKAENHKTNANNLGFNWNNNGQHPLGYMLIPSDRHRIEGVLLQIDPDKFPDKNQLEIAIQHLWVRSAGYGVAHDSPLPLAIESTFTNGDSRHNKQLPPFSRADHTAIRLFLEDNDIFGMDREKLHGRLFMRKRDDLWKFH